MFCGLPMDSPSLWGCSPSEISPRVSARALASLCRRRITRVLAERLVGLSSDCASATSLARAAGGPRMIRRLVRESAITWMPAEAFAWPRSKVLLSSSAASMTQACRRSSTL
ncbi:hypothetical protein D9M69_667030 [compost metagenome]